MSTVTQRRWARRRTALFAAVCLTTAALVMQTPGLGQPTSAAAASQPWMNTKLPAAQRAKLLVAQMTLDEKITMVAGAGAGGRYDIQPIPRLGIPGGDNIDSGIGVRLSSLNTTSFPSGLSLASSYSGDATRAQGAAVGNEAFLTGQNQLLGPTIDIARNPYEGRDFENFGEDPLLTRVLGGDNISGIQSNPVIAVVKHYVSNTQETHRTTVDEEVSQRALHEIYLPPFEGAIGAGAGGIMCSLNKVNGDYVCQNQDLLTNLLKGQLGFKGFVQTDYNSLGSGGGDTVKAANAGLDVDLPDGVVFGHGQLKAAIQAGTVPMSRLDDMVLRLLTAYFSQGLFDHPAPGISDPNYVRQPLPQNVVTADDNLALQLGQQGSVLLKNNGILPLSSSKVRSIAVIGGDANWNIQGGGSSSVPNPTHLTTYLAGIQQRSGAKVEYVPGTDPSSWGDMVGGPAPIPSSVLTPAGGSAGQTGLRGDFFLNGTIGGTPDYTQVDKEVNATFGLVGNLTGIVQTPNYPLNIGGVGAHGWAGKWTGTLTPPTTGTYTLSTTHWGSARLVVDGKEIIPKTAGPNMNTVTSAQVNLQAGKPVSVEMDYWLDEPTAWSGHGGAQVRLGWVPPTGTLSPDMQKAVDAAKRSDVAIVVVRDVNSESADRGTLTLPQDQNRLIEAVAKANPRTIVIGATGGPYPMPWIKDVGAVLQTWYAGQEQGKVAASILYGDVNPGGKLPISFPLSDSQQPINTVQQWPGVNDVATHTEGIYVGYRGYDKFGFTPQFPFGYGLSYTTFSLSKLKIKDPNTRGWGGYGNGNGNGNGKPGSVEVRVTNTGTKVGTQTVQVYEGHLPTRVDTPSRQLIGWAKVTLAPGQTKTVSVSVDVTNDHALSYWDVTANRWVTPKGTVPIYVGNSETDTQLAGSMTVR
jgi:beta-glucosidase